MITLPGIWLIQKQLSLIPFTGIKSKSSIIFSRFNQENPFPNRLSLNE